MQSLLIQNDDVEKDPQLTIQQSFENLEQSQFVIPPWLDRTFWVNIRNSHFGTKYLNYVMNFLSNQCVMFKDGKTKDLPPYLNQCLLSVLLVLISFSYDYPLDESFQTLLSNLISSGITEMVEGAELIRRILSQKIAVELFLELFKQKFMSQFLNEVIPLFSFYGLILFVKNDPSQFREICIFIHKKIVSSISMSTAFLYIHLLSTIISIFPSLGISFSEQFPILAGIFGRFLAFPAPLSSKAAEISIQCQNENNYPGYFFYNTIYRASRINPCFNSNVPVYFDSVHKFIPNYLYNPYPCSQSLKLSFVQFGRFYIFSKFGSNKELPASELLTLFSNFQFNKKNMAKIKEKYGFEFEAQSSEIIQNPLNESNDFLVNSSEFLDSLYSNDQFHDQKLRNRGERLSDHAIQNLPNLDIEVGSIDSEIPPMSEPVRLLNPEPVIEGFVPLPDYGDEIKDKSKHKKSKSKSDKTKTKSEKVTKRDGYKGPLNLPTFLFNLQRLTLNAPFSFDVTQPIDKTHEIFASPTSTILGSTLFAPLSKVTSDPLSPVSFHIMLLGEDFLLGNILLAYFCACNSNPDLNSYLIIYNLVPIDLNNDHYISEYISSKDPLYKYFINSLYTVTSQIGPVYGEKSNAVFCSVEEDQPRYENNSWFCEPSPSSFFQNFLQYYLHFAREFMEIGVWKCVLETDEGNPKKVVVPFISSILFDVGDRPRQMLLSYRLLSGKAVAKKSEKIGAMCIYSVNEDLHLRPIDETLGLEMSSEIIQLNRESRKQNAKKINFQLVNILEIEGDKIPLSISLIVDGKTINNVRKMKVVRMTVPNIPKQLLNIRIATFVPVN